MTPATYHLPTIRRGDSVAAFGIATLTYTEDEIPVPVSSARMQIRNSRDVVIFSASTGAGLTLIDAGELRFDGIAPATTAGFPVGDYKYDLEITLTSGAVWTVLEGNVTISPDVTR